MNDVFVECLVERKTSPFAAVIQGLVYALAGLCFLGGIFGISVLLLPAIGLALLAYFVFPNFYLEFEYSYLDKELSVDKIMKKQKRKHIETIDLSKMELMAICSSHELDSYKNRKDVKIVDYTSKIPDRKTYAIVYPANNQLQLIYIEPNEELIHAIKSVFPRKVISL